MSLVGLMDALATQIQSELCGTANPVIPELQVGGSLIDNPSLPCIDIYPFDVDFQEQVAFNEDSPGWQFQLRVRARVGMADNEGGQRLLLQMMDPGSNHSVYQAVLSNKTLGGAGRVVRCGGADGYGQYPSAWSPTPRFHFGCEWIVLVET